MNKIKNKNNAPKDICLRMQKKKKKIGFLFYRRNCADL